MSNTMQPLLLTDGNINKSIQVDGVCAQYPVGFNMQTYIITPLMLFTLPMNV
jgi:hypothetical protein